MPTSPKDPKLVLCTYIDEYLLYLYIKICHFFTLKFVEAWQERIVSMKAATIPLYNETAVYSVHV